MSFPLLAPPFDTTGEPERTDVIVAPLTAERFAVLNVYGWAEFYARDKWDLIGMLYVLSPGYRIGLPKWRLWLYAAMHRQLPLQRTQAALRAWYSSEVAALPLDYLSDGVRLMPNRVVAHGMSKLGLSEQQAWSMPIKTLGALLSEVQPGGVS